MKRDSERAFADFDEVRRDPPSETGTSGCKAGARARSGRGRQVPYVHARAVLRSLRVHERTSFNPSSEAA